ncbi:MAG: hypothetical protein R3E86_14450 [Pseudomonadales bacterium]
MQRLAGYPRWFHPVLLGILALLFGTGIALVPPMLDMRLDMDVPWQLDAGTRLACAVWHAAAAFVAVGLSGALLAIHTRIGWRRRLNRISGTALLALMVILLSTGLGLYYAGAEAWILASSAAHAGLGILSAPVFVWHLFRGRRLRRDPALWKHAGD